MLWQPGAVVQPLALGMEEGTAEMLRTPEQSKACGARKNKSGRLKPKGTKITKMAQWESQVLTTRNKKHRMAICILIYLVGIKIFEQLNIGLAHLL